MTGSRDRRELVKMKEIKAYVKAHKLYDLTHALRGIEGLSGMSAVRVEGFGAGRASASTKTTEDSLELLKPHVKVEVVCADELSDEIVATILRVAHTGLSGDGCIYVSRIEEAYRIATQSRDDGML